MCGQEWGYGVWEWEAGIENVTAQDMGQAWAPVNGVLPFSTDWHLNKTLGRAHPTAQVPIPQPLPPQRDEAAALKVKELELQLKMMGEEAERRSAHERMMKVLAGAEALVLGGVSRRCVVSAGSESSPCSIAPQAQPVCVCVCVLPSPTLPRPRSKPRSQPWRTS